MSAKRQLDFDEFLADHPVFTLSRLARARGDGGTLGPARNQLKHHLRRGRVVAVAREIFAAVPHGIDAGDFTPDPFHVAAAARPRGIFAYHSALELLGQAHSVWGQITLHCLRRRAPLQIGTTEILFLATPRALVRANQERIGTREVIRRDVRLTATGPERTLVEGLRQPHRAGGLEEHVESVAGFAALDFELLERVLRIYDERAVWAAVGWLVEDRQAEWRPPRAFLELCRGRRPRQNQYLLRERRGGTKVPGWNLIVPTHLVRGFEGHAADV